MRKLISVVFLVLLVGVSTGLAVNTWTGGATGNWFDGLKWSSGVPVSGDDVVINTSGATVSLTNSTAALSTLAINGGATLVFSNWTSMLSATNVTIGNNGTLKHVLCNTNLIATNGVWYTGTNRVYISCSNLTIDAGGAINVDYTGWLGGWPFADAGNSANWYGTGQGPGAGSGTGGGASYGGLGSHGGYVSTQGVVYGSVASPVDPGSGGGAHYTSGYGGNGGGAVYIDAHAGTVTINGTISANGDFGKASRGGSGSGGGIYINCRVLAGTTGIVRANGGSTGGTYYGGGGGGGRIAVLYNQSAQSLANQTAKPTVKFSANQGGNQVVEPDLDKDIPSAPGPSSPGTLYFTDNSFFPSETLLGGQIVIPGFTTWSPNNLTVSNGNLTFADGFILRVSNDVTLLDLGGLSVSNWQAVIGGNLVCSNTAYGKTLLQGGPSFGFSVGGNLTLNSGYLEFRGDPTNASTLTVGGSLYLTNAAKFKIYSGMTNASSPDHGALVNVTNDISLGLNSWIYPTSHPTNGGSALFIVRNLTIATNAGFNANLRGYDVNLSTYIGYGPGHPSDKYYGGGYGGAGGGGGGGHTYGSSNAPVDCGSAGAMNVAPKTANINNGGGLVRVQASRDVTLDGSILANGGVGGTAGSENGGGGSGGGVYITCRKFQGQSTGAIQANGAALSVNYGGGGGGRVALWVRQYGYLGSVMASGGTNINYPSNSGATGTVVKVLLPPVGTVISVH